MMDVILSEAKNLACTRQMFRLRLNMTTPQIISNRALEKTKKSRSLSFRKNLPAYFIISAKILRFPPLRMAGLAVAGTATPFVIPSAAEESIENCHSRETCPERSRRIYFGGWLAPKFTFGVPIFSPPRRIGGFCAGSVSNSTLPTQISTQKP
jgi:hypothetical protein